MRSGLCAHKVNMQGFIEAEMRVDCILGRTQPVGVLTHIHAHRRIHTGEWTVHNHLWTLVYCSTFGAIKGAHTFGATRTLLVSAALSSLSVVFCFTCVPWAVCCIHKSWHRRLSLTRLWYTVNYISTVATVCTRLCGLAAYKYVHHTHILTLRASGSLIN